MKKDPKKPKKIFNTSVFLFKWTSSTTVNRQNHHHYTQCFRMGQALEKLKVFPL